MLGPSSTAAKFNEGWGSEKKLKPIKDAVSVEDVEIEIDSKLAQKTKRESLFPKSEVPAQLPQLANNNPIKKNELQWSNIDDKLAR